MLAAGAAGWSRSPSSPGARPPGWPSARSPGRERAHRRRPARDRARGHADRSAGSGAAAPRSAGAPHRGRGARRLRRPDARRRAAGRGAAHRGARPAGRRAARPDLAIDLHGNRSPSREPLAALRPARLIVFVRPGEPVPPGVEASLWDDDEHEVARWCRLLREHLPDVGELPPVWSVLPTPAPVLPGATVLHPGAAAGSRRWPVERWAAVARALAADGHRLVVTGTAAEQSLVDAVARPAEAETATRLDVERARSAWWPRPRWSSRGTPASPTSRRRSAPRPWCCSGPSRRPAGDHRTDPGTRRCGRHPIRPTAANPHGSEPDPVLLGISVDDVLAAVPRALRRGRSRGPGRGTGRARMTGDPGDPADPVDPVSGSRRPGRRYDVRASRSLRHGRHARRDRGVLGRGAVRAGPPARRGALRTGPAGDDRVQHADVDGRSSTAISASSAREAELLADSPVGGGRDGGHARRGDHLAPRRGGSAALGARGRARHRPGDDDVPRPWPTSCWPPSAGTWGRPLRPHPLRRRGAGPEAGSRPLPDGDGSPRRPARGVRGGGGLPGGHRSGPGRRAPRCSACPPTSRWRRLPR